MEDERDLIVFSDDEGNELTMEVLDYFYYEGKEYAIVAELEEDCESCEGACEGCEKQRDTFVMQVNPVGEDEEEFVPVEEELEQRLMELVENGLYDTEDEFADDEEDE